MKKYILILLLMISFSAFSETKMDNISINQKFDTERVIKDMDTINAKMNESFKAAGQFYHLMRSEVKTYGLKKTLQINSFFFAPFFIILALYLIWLKNRKK